MEEYDAPNIINADNRSQDLEKVLLFWKNNSGFSVNEFWIKGILLKEIPQYGNKFLYKELKHIIDM
jgi:hypothetical protein